MEITRELVRDPVELVFSDGKRYATQRWVTRCTDVRECAAWKDGDTSYRMMANFGWVDIGEPFPTPDSVASPLYEPPAPTIWQRIKAALTTPEKA